MARITVEDCVDKVESPYELVLISKERTVQLNSGEKPNVEKDNDKNTVIALREIAEKKVSVKQLEESAIYKLRKNIEEDVESTEEEEITGDNFESLYKGEISKSGIPILPSKRARKIPQKIEAFKTEEDKTIKTEEDKTIKTEEDKTISDENDHISLETLQEQEKTAEDTKE